MQPPAGDSKKREAARDHAAHPRPDPGACTAAAASPPPLPLSSAAQAPPMPPQKSVSDLTQEAPPAAAAMPAVSNPYVMPSPAPLSTSKNTMETVNNVLGRWGKKVGEATKKAEGLAGDMWQHLKTGPSMADAAMGMIAQGSKVLAEGGYEKIFQQTFDMLPEEKLRKSYACYLSTSAGPVMGILYLSSAKLAFCSDNPLSYKVVDQTEWSYYKSGRIVKDYTKFEDWRNRHKERMVKIPLHQLRAVNASISKVNRAEKYIQIVSVDNHEFWFMGFVNYDNAVKNLQEALHDARELQP